MSHAEYRAALDEVLRDYRVDALLVSSLIGHSLEILDTGLPTVVVNHDYFPYCPAINIHFDGICVRCDAKRIVECHEGNPRFNPFVDFLPDERIAVRERFMELVRRPECVDGRAEPLGAANLVRLNPAFAEVAFATIPHGYGDPLERLPAPEPSDDDRLRIVVLGQLSVPKGVELLRGALAELTRFAEVYLMGCRELGELFKFEPHVHVTSDYEIAELPVHVANINPHVGLLMSIVPETFSYALTELMMLGVPVAATRVGSFDDRIRHGENGFLFDPEAVAACRGDDGDRRRPRALARGAARTCAGWKPRTPQRDGRATTTASRPVRRAPAPTRCSRKRRSPAARRPRLAEAAYAAQALTIAGMWKQVQEPATCRSRS